MVEKTEYPNVDFEQLQHMRAFQSGFICYNPAFDPKCYGSQPGYVYGAWRTLRDFRGFSSLCPFEADKQDGKVSHQVGAYTKEYQPALTTAQLQEIASRHFKRIQPTKLRKLERVAVIYNPQSGSKRDVRAIIQQTFSERGVEPTFFDTTGPMHGQRLAENEIEVRDYDALVAVGGDGTLHEVINGLLQRPDGRKIPIAFVPNGSGNDTCHGLGISTVEQALAGILKGETIKLDVNRVLMDAETEQDIPLDERATRLRYSLINASIGFIAKCVFRGATLKKYFGSLCYSAAGVVELTGRQRSEDFAVELEQGDGTTLVIPQISSQIVMIMNGKCGGTHIPFTPMAMMNDGLLDILLMEGHFSHLFSGLKMLRSAKDYQGLHVYTDNMLFFRGTKVKFTNLNYEDPAELVEEIDGNVVNIQQVQSKKPQMFQVDGEGLLFTDFAKIEVVPKALDVLIDFNEVMRASGMYR